jgi:hypothetical protein
MRAAPVLGLAVSAALLVACTGTPQAPLPELGSTAVGLVVEEDGPWQEVSAEGASPGAVLPPARPSAAASAPGRRRLSRRPPEPMTPDLPELMIPDRRATPEPAAVPRAPVKSPERVARERYLDHPTRVRAERITFYCPPAYAAEVRLGGDELRETSPGRRQAEGHARLFCRELTLEAEVIILKVRDDGLDDLQVMARGDVSFVTDQKGQVMHEDGIRSLMLTNDEILPLR